MPLINSLRLRAGKLIIFQWRHTREETHSERDSEPNNIRSYEYGKEQWSLSLNRSLLWIGWRVGEQCRNTFCYVQVIHFRREYFYCYYNNIYLWTHRRSLVFGGHGQTYKDEAVDDGPSVYCRLESRQYSPMDGMLNLYLKNGKVLQHNI